MREKHTVPVVDGHLHLFKAQSENYPRVTYDDMAPADREETAERFLEVMDANGVDHAIVVPLSPEDHYLAELLDRSEGRFAGIGMHDSEVADPVADLERRIDETPIQGMRLYGLGAEPGSDPEALRVFPLLRSMRDHDMKVWFYGPPDQVDMLDKTMDLLPGLTVVMNHLAFSPDIDVELRFDEYRRPRFDEVLPPPSLERAERLAAKHDTMYVHFSGHYAFTHEPYPYLDLQETCRRIYDAFGADRMLMASDWPWIQEEPGYGETLALVDVHLPDLTDAERAAIRGGAALSLFDFGAVTGSSR